METTLDEALDVMNRWAAADRTIKAVGEAGMITFHLNGHLVDIGQELIRLLFTDVGIVTFDPRNKNIDYSDVREAPAHVRDTLSEVYDESLFFKIDDKNALMLAALLETGAK